MGYRVAVMALRGDSDCQYALDLAREARATCGNSPVRLIFVGAPLGVTLGIIFGVLMGYPVPTKARCSYHMVARFCWHL